MRFILLLFFQISLFAAEFEYIFIGTSPFSLFEALYQAHSGKKVLILEKSPFCGGAWRSIPICGVPHADLGCHQIGDNQPLKEFLEEYAGCQIVSMDNPQIPYEKENSKNGYYFSQGCFELIDNLLKLIAATDIVLLTDHTVENVTVDPQQKVACVKTETQTFSTEKLIVTPMSCFHLSPTTTEQKFSKSKYYHLYMLIQDPSPFRFTYQNGLTAGVSRVMNLTHFTGLAGTGRQLIVIQAHNEQHLTSEQTFLEELKKKDLLDPSAYILQSEPLIYESGSFHQALINQAGAEGIIEVLQTGHFQGLNNFIAKWKTVLPRYPH